MDTTHDGEKNDEVSDRETSLSTETPPTKKSKHIPAQYLQRSNERNELIKKIQARNDQLLMREEEKLDEIDMFFRGLAITAKKFPCKGRIEAKKKNICINDRVGGKIFSTRTTNFSISIYSPTSSRSHSDRKHVFTVSVYKSSISINKCIFGIYIMFTI